MAAGLTACGGSSGGSSGGGGSSASAASSSLVVETAFVLKTLDPARMFEPTGLMIDHTLYDTLLTYKGSDVTTPVPDLATSYTASSDAKTYTFTLRKGVKFANGDPVTAADVVFSLMRTKNIEGNPSFLMAGITATSPNANTVVLTSATPNTAIPAILTNPALGIVDAKKVQAAGGSDGSGRGQVRQGRDGAQHDVRGQRSVHADQLQQHHAGGADREPEVLGPQGPSRSTARS